MPGVKPNFEQAGCYSATLHYLKVADAMGIAAAKQDGRATIARLKATPWADDAYGSGHIREDGRNLNPAYLFRVKTPAESKAPWDYYTLVATTPGDEAFRPLAAGGCPFIHV
jgi:branched-chain amino acid transport system substrate-binding protein